MSLVRKKRILAEQLCLAGLMTGLLAAPVAGWAWEAKIIEMPGQSAAQQSGTFTIVGGVQRPGSYRLAEKKLSLEQLIARAGGLDERAGVKVRVLLGGRASVVLMYPEQKAFELNSGDLVIFERRAVTSARIVNFQEFSNGTEQPVGNPHGPQPTPVIRPVSHDQRPVSRGHVVLVGLQQEPVVMPLWTAGLTTDLLLTTYLKQPAYVAEQTRVLHGRPGGKSGQELTDGMVLSVPTRLVSASSLPQLPPVITAAYATETASPAAGEFGSGPKHPQNLPFLQPERLAGGSELLPVPAQQPHSARPANNVPHSSTGVDSTQVDSTADNFDDFSEDESSDLLMMPSLVPGDLPNSSAEGLGSQQRNQASSPLNQEQFRALAQTVEATESEHERTRLLQQMFATGTPLPLSTGSEQAAEKPADVWVEDFVDAVTGENPFENLTSSVREVQHLAAADEVVPAPHDPPTVQKIPLAGLITGFLVVAGVLVVISTAVRRKLLEMFQQNLSGPSLWHPAAATYSQSPSLPTREPIIRQQQRQPQPPREMVSESTPAPVATEGPVEQSTAVAPEWQPVAELLTAEDQPVVTREPLIPALTPTKFSAAEQSVTAKSAVEIVASEKSGPENSLATAEAEVVAAERCLDEKKEMQTTVPEQTVVTDAFPEQPDVEAPNAAQPVLEQSAPACVTEFPEECTPRAEELEAKGCRVESTPAPCAETKLLAWLNWPIEEERVDLPREMKFFGKPKQHYEFRIDGAHPLKKPHLLAAFETSETGREAAVPVTQSSPPRRRESQRTPSREPVMAAANVTEEQSTAAIVNITAHSNASANAGNSFGEAAAVTSETQIPAATTEQNRASESVGPTEATAKTWLSNPEAGLFASAYALAEQELVRKDGSFDYT